MSGRNGENECLLYRVFEGERSSIPIPPDWTFKWVECNSWLPTEYSISPIVCVPSAQPCGLRGRNYYFVINRKFCHDAIFAIPDGAATMIHLVSRKTGLGLTVSCAKEEDWTKDNVIVC